jgi:hypothetical protein
MVRPGLAACCVAILCATACEGSPPSETGDIPTGTLSSGGMPGGLGNLALAATTTTEMEALLTMVGSSPDPNCVSANGWELRCWSGWGDFKDRAGVVYVAMVAGGNPCDRLTGVRSRLIGATLKVTPFISEASSCGGARIGQTAQIFWVERSRLGDGLLDVEARRASQDGTEYGESVFATLDLRRLHTAIGDPTQNDGASAFQWALGQVAGRYGSGTVPIRLGFVWEDPQQPCGGLASVDQAKLGYQMDFLPTVGSPWYRVAGGNGIGLLYCGPTSKPAGAT